MDSEVKIATLEGVREYNECEPVELWIRAGRIIVRAFNECRNNHTDVDLVDLLGRLQSTAETAEVAISLLLQRVKNDERGYLPDLNPNESN